MAKYIRKGYACKAINIISHDFMYSQDTKKQLKNRLLVNTCKVKYPILDYIQRSVKTLFKMGREIRHISVSVELLDKIRAELRERGIEPTRDILDFIHIKYGGIDIILEYNPEVPYGYMEMYGIVTDTGRAETVLDKSQGA